MDEEVWRPVAGYEGVYEVSSRGRIKRVLAGQGTRVGTILKGRITKGYLYVNLCLNGKRRGYRINRLVCEAFHGPSFGRESNHRNGIKTDNRSRNLEWSTHSQNNLHKTRVLGHGAGVNHHLFGVVGSDHRDSLAYTAVSPDGRTFYFSGLNEFCRQNGLTPSAMCRVAQGRAKHHKGWCCRPLDDSRAAA